MEMATFKTQREWILHETTAHAALGTQRITTGECPFCLIKVQKPDKMLARHMCRHMRELSLASLPASEFDEDEDEVKNINNNKRGLQENSEEEESDNDVDSCSEQS